MNFIAVLLPKMKIMVALYPKSYISLDINPLAKGELSLKFSDPLLPVFSGNKNYKQTKTHKKKKKKKPEAETC